MLKMKMNALVPGLIIGRNVVSSAGRILVARGVKLNSRVIQQLKEQGIEEVHIMQSTDLLNPVTPKTLKSKTSYYKKNVKSEENLQNLLDQIIRNELTHAATSFFRYQFSHFGMQSPMERRIFELLDVICKDVHVILLLSQMKSYQPEYIQRYVKVAVLSLMMGIDLGMDDERLLQLGKSAFFYNIGHIILMHSRPTKNGESNEAYKQLYPQHTTVGYEYLKRIFDEEIAKVAFEHHERVSGGGFPKNKSGSEISLLSKIVMVAGRFISLQIKNDTRPAIMMDVALDYILTVEGYFFDQNVVNSFRKFVSPYPQGAIIELSDGSRAIVVKPGAAPDYHPLIKVLHKASTSLDKGGFLYTHELDELYIKKECTFSHFMN